MVRGGPQGVHIHTYTAAGAAVYPQRGAVAYFMWSGSQVTIPGKV